MVQHKTAKADDEKAKAEEPVGEVVSDDAPTPTQAEIDEARLRMGRAFEADKSGTYQTREAKSE